MPRLFINRKRQHALYADKKASSAHNTWEWISSALYFIGACLLIPGSVLFLPKYGEYEETAIWLFVAATILYLIVSLHDCLEVFKMHKSNHGPGSTFWMDFSAASTYIVGSVLFIVGSAFFLPDVAKEIAGGWCFIIGSVFFLIGSCVNVLQIWESPSKLTAQYANLEAISFVTGSCFYLAGSVPYTYELADDTDATLIFRLCANLFIVGSVLYLAGAIFNMVRFPLVNKVGTEEKKMEDGVEFEKETEQ